MRRVAVSVLNFNSASDTIACVQSLLNAHQNSDELCVLKIFISDNNSVAEQQHQLTKSLAELPLVILQMNDQNKGFAAGHNDNIRAILEDFHPDYVWILNNDCQVYPQTLAALIDCSERQPGVGIWGATLLEQDGETIQCAGGCFYNSWLSSYSQFGSGRSLASLEHMESVSFDYIAGASLFFPVITLQDGLRPLCESINSEDTQHQQWLNEDFFLYFEELDLARRLRPNFGMAWCKNALIKHTGGVSTGTESRQRTTLAEYHSTLSALKYTRLYHPRRMWIVAPVRYLSKILLLASRGDFHLIGVLTRAYRDFWID